MATVKTKSLIAYLVEEFEKENDQQVPKGFSTFCEEKIARMSAPRYSPAGMAVDTVDTDGEILTLWLYETAVKDDDVEEPSIRHPGSMSF